MLERIKKLKNRKGKIDQGLKSCKWCGRDYQEDNNFQWSCIRHTGDYSQDDEIYWCCGKRGKNTPGCKKSKHQQKEDDEDEEALLRGKQK